MILFWRDFSAEEGKAENIFLTCPSLISITYCYCKILHCWDHNKAYDRSWEVYLFYSSTQKFPSVLLFQALLGGTVCQSLQMIYIRQIGQIFFYPPTALIWSWKFLVYKETEEIEDSWKNDPRWLSLHSQVLTQVCFSLSLSCYR